MLFLLLQIPLLITGVKRNSGRPGLFLLCSFSNVSLAESVTAVTDSASETLGKEHHRYENNRLGLIESVHVQYSKVLSNLFYANSFHMEINLKERRFVAKRCALIRENMVFLAGTIRIT